jgi:hypothetical protein
VPATIEYNSRSTKNHQEISLSCVSINKKLWNKKTAILVDSDFYEMEDFLNGKNTLMPIELPLLVDVRGKSILHLQYHFGQDSPSLAPMGI